ncbi:hypothetical protein DM02DRAFT_620386, partial [Periconia macrospinosa]
RRDRSLTLAICTSVEREDKLKNYVIWREVLADISKSCHTRACNLCIDSF